MQDLSIPKTTDSGDVVSVGYSIDGKECDVNDVYCVAKTTVDTDTGYKKCWAKRATHGHSRGLLFNPQDMNYQAESFRRKWAATGKDFYEWSRIEEDKFGHYVRFLQTGNPSLLRHAERM